MSALQIPFKPAEKTREISTRMAILFLVIMAGTYVINGMDRQVFPVLVPWIMKTYEFNLQEAGLLSTVFTIGLGLAGIPTGYLLDRSSRKTVMIVGLLFYSVFTVLTVMSAGFADMLIYRAITGIGEGMQVAAVFAAAGNYFYRNRTLVIGVMNVAYGIGGFIGPFFGAKLTLLTNSWHTPFYVYGFVGITCAIAAWFLLPKAFTDSKGALAETVVPENAALFSHVPATLWNRNVILCSIAAGITGLTMFGYIGLYSTFLIQQLHYQPMVASLALSLYGVGCMMAIPIGYIGDRLPQRFIMIFSFASSMVSSYLMFNVCTEPWQQNVLSFLQGVLFSACLFVNVYALIQRSVRPAMVGRASGIHVTSIFLPASVSGFIFATLIKYLGWGHAASILLSASPLLGIAVMVLLKESQLMMVARKQG